MVINTASKWIDVFLKRGQERIKDKQVNLPYRPYPHLNPSVDVDFPAGNVISRVEWKILGKENSKMLVNAKLEQDL